jgi:glycosyltransferase involved in cell wall biosynthesis
MQLSVCLMVRNEEANLPRALDSVLEVADEILVIDTGSVDSTVAIAESRGARVLHYDWQDDFSAPHNFGWDQARGEWLLWLDGDESLMASSIPHLRECLKRKDVGAFYIQRQEILDSADPSRFTEMIMLRLYRRELPTRFVGQYHTQIIAPPGWMAARSGVRLQHWRYKADNLLRARRGARIMARELESDPENMYLMIELANALSDLGDAKAGELRRSVARMLRPRDEVPPTVAVVYILDHLITHKDEATEVGYSFDDLRAMCWRWFPYNAPLKWAIAQRLFAEEDFQGAMVELMQLIQLVETDELDKLVPFDPRVREDAEFNLAVCLTRLAHLNDAEKLFRRFLDHPKRGGAARANLDVIAHLRTFEET